MVGLASFILAVTEPAHAILHSAVVGRFGLPLHAGDIAELIEREIEPKGQLVIFIVYLLLNHVQVE